MSRIGSFRAIIELWPSKEAMASDVGSGLKAPAVSKWWQRDSIPAEWWSVVLATSAAKAAGVTAATMTALAARAPETDRASVEARA